MEKRFILAIVLCTLIYMVGTTYLLPKPPARKPATPDPASTSVTPEPGTGPTPAEDPSTGEIRAATPSDIPDHPVTTHVLRDEQIEFSVTSEGAGLSGVVLAQYQEDDHKTRLALFDDRILGAPGDASDASRNALVIEVDGIDGLDRRSWETVSTSDTQVVYQMVLDDSRRVKKTIRLDDASRPFIAHVDVEFTGFTAGKYRIFGPQRFRCDTGNRQAANQRVIGLMDASGHFESAERKPVSILEPDGERRDARPIAWGGLESNYFAMVLRPEFPSGPEGVLIERSGTDPALSGAVKSQQAKGIQGLPYRVGFERAIPANASHTYEMFLGPKDRGLLAAYHENGYDELVYFGSWLGPLVRLFLWLLAFFNGLFGSYGIAIICLTLVVKTLLHPLNKRNQGMMQRQQKKMAKIQPKLNKAKEQYKNDPARANAEIQRLMKEHEVNPAAMFGGCLLIFLQLPIWIGLINTFSLATEMRHEGFLWFDDLTQPDRLFSWGASLPYVGEYLNLLPILYVCVTLINQRMMPRNPDPNMAQQQKIMTFMMVAFGFIFYGYPSGLLLYFLTSASLGIIEQRIIRAELKREELA